MLEIEDILLNPTHSIYISKPKLMSVWLVELQLDENGAVEVYEGGRPFGYRPPTPGSKEDWLRKTDKTIVHPISVYHSVLDLALLNHFRNLINCEPDYCVLFYRISRHNGFNRIDIRITDIDLSKLEVYANRIRAIVGDYCIRVSYPSFEYSLGSPDAFFSKGFPITKSGMIIEKYYWDGENKKYRMTNNDISNIESFLKNYGCLNIKTLDDNPEFWKISFESQSIWGDNLYNEMRKNGFYGCKIYTDSGNDSFITESHPRSHWKIVSVKRHSDIDDEESVMRAISNGQGNSIGRD